jgi:hypothetical protein
MPKGLSRNKTLDLYCALEYSELLTKRMSQRQAADAAIRARYRRLKGTLTERGPRLFAGREALAFGYGGVSAVAVPAGASRAADTCQGAGASEPRVPSTVGDEAMAQTRVPHLQPGPVTPPTSPSACIGRCFPTRFWWYGGEEPFKWRVGLRRVQP